MNAGTRALVAAVVAAAASGPIRAADFCPQNEVELRAALSAAQSNGQSDIIRLLATTYFTGGVKFSAVQTEAHDLTISGGWQNSGIFLCAAQAGSAGATVLDAQGSSAVLEFSQGSGPFATGTTLTLQNLTLRNGLTAVNGESAALSMFGGIGQALRVERLVAIDSRQGTVGPNIYSNAVTLAGFGDIYLLDSLIAGTQSNYATLGVFSFTGGSTVFLTNNTLSVTGGPLNALLDANAGSNFRLANNAIVGTLNVNSRSAGDLIQLYLLHNVGQWSTAFSFNLVTDLNNLRNVDPGFVGAGNYRPAAGSLLINRGLNAPFGGVPGVDLDGGPRVVFGTIDVGAYESSAAAIFANGFE